MTYEVFSNRMVIVIFTEKKIYLKKYYKYMLGVSTCVSCLRRSRQGANQILKSDFSILHERSTQFFWRGVSSLSIKSFYNGSAFYNTGQGNYRVTENNYLLLNHGQDYSITIDSDTTVESFCIFFSENWTKDIYSTLLLTEEELLEDIDTTKLDVSSTVFFEKTYPLDQLVTPIMNSIRFSVIINRVNPLWLESQLYLLLQNMITLHRKEIKKINYLTGVRFSTRKEIFKRVSIGHEYMNAFYNRNIRLEDIARAAMLSPNHFLRCYKQIFGVTPNQFLSEKRLQVAKHLLLKTKKPITQICYDVGFQSVSNFSWIFSLRFSCAPSQLRKKNYECPIE